MDFHDGAYDDDGDSCYGNGGIQCKSFFRRRRLFTERFLLIMRDFISGRSSICDVDFEIILRDDERLFPHLSDDYGYGRVVIPRCLGSVMQAKHEIDYIQEFFCCLLKNKYIKKLKLYLAGQTNHIAAALGLVLKSASDGAIKSSELLKNLIHVKLDCKESLQ